MGVECRECVRVLVHTEQGSELAMFSSWRSNQIIDRYLSKDF